MGNGARTVSWYGVESPLVFWRLSKAVRSSASRDEKPEARSVESGYSKSISMPSSWNWLYAATMFFTKICLFFAVDTAGEKYLQNAKK